MKTNNPILKATNATVQAINPPKFIQVTEARTGNAYRINTDYIVAYRPTKLDSKESFANSMITCKSSIANDPTPLYVDETCQQIDSMLLTKYYIGE